jgi:hypothetical protein
MIPREQVLTYLHGKQVAYGGYTGNDITKLAEFLNVTSQGVNYSGLEALSVYGCLG